MTPQDWKKAWEIYQAASELTDAERESYLNKKLADDPAIREEVARLIAENQAENQDDAQTPETIGETPRAIGPYRLIKTIGEGGMGTVFLAEQERPLRRKVALKLIRRGLQTPEVLARFEIERQALAILDHPNVARVFDAGTTTPGGHPYFVMEFVDGLPINRYCEERGLSVRDRLKLIQQVCDAIQHAHSRAIIHRDIKPANVLVAEQDGKPVPRVIDFGVAKAVGTTSADQTMATGFGSVVGTLRYISPEQAMDSQDIDARTDIYAVGVLLYELLTGTTPLAWEGDESASLPVVLQRIAESEPPPRSRRLRESSASQRLSKPLEGEVDWIVMKALEKDRARRYQTAEAMYERVLKLRRQVLGPEDPETMRTANNLGYETGKTCQSFFESLRRAEARRQGGSHRGMHFHGNVVSHRLHPIHRFKQWRGRRRGQATGEPVHGRQDCGLLLGNVIEEPVFPDGNSHSNSKAVRHGAATAGDDHVNLSLRHRGGGRPHGGNGHLPIERKRDFVL